MYLDSDVLQKDDFDANQYSIEQHMDDDIMTDYNILGNAMRTCKQDLAQAAHLISGDSKVVLDSSNLKTEFVHKKLSLLLYCQNVEVLARIKFPHLFNRQAMYRDNYPRKKDDISITYCVLKRSRSEPKT